MKSTRSPWNGMANNKVMLASPGHPNGITKLVTITNVLMKSNEGNISITAKSQQIHLS